MPLPLAAIGLGVLASVIANCLTDFGKDAVAVNNVLDLLWKLSVRKPGRVLKVLREGGQYKSVLSYHDYWYEVFLKEPRGWDNRARIWSKGNEFLFSYWENGVQVYNAVKYTPDQVRQALLNAKLLASRQEATKQKQMA